MVLMRFSFDLLLAGLRREEPERVSIPFVVTEAPLEVFGGLISPLPCTCCMLPGSGVGARAY